MKKPTVILIDTDKALGDMYSYQLQQRFKVKLARRAQDAIDILDSEGADAIVTDVVVAKNNGLEIIYELRSYDDWAEIPVIILSSLPERSFTAQPDWQSYNVASFLYKPHTSPQVLMRSVSAALS